MAKKKTINELRQTKDAYYVHPTFNLKSGFQGGVIKQAKTTEEHDKPSQGFIQAQEEAAEYKEWANKANKSPEMKQNRDMNPSKYTQNDLEQAKCSIAEKVTKHFQDVIFEMVCEEMGNNYLFQSDNYLTEAGYDIFEDEWFEFYHEHHGDIMHQVMQNIGGVSAF